MNCGLSNLDTLKRSLLSEGLRAGTKFDDLLKATGLGVAAMFERITNRKFARTAGDVVLLAGDKTVFYLPRCPVEALTSVELSTTPGSWTTVTGSVVNWQAGSGLLYFGGPLGAWWDSVRVTYTGGYWFETAEPEDEGYPTSQAAGSTALPADLLDAYMLQVRAVWQAIDKLGADVLRTGSSSQFVSGSLAGLDLVPQVKLVLGQYGRHQLL